MLPVMEHECVAGRGQVHQARRGRIVVPEAVSDNARCKSGDGVRPSGPRRSRAAAALTRKLARSFWRGVRCAAGPPGITPSAAEPKAVKPPIVAAPHRGGLKVRDMTIAEFALAAAAVRTRVPHMSNEWSSRASAPTAAADIREAHSANCRGARTLLAIADKPRDSDTCVRSEERKLVRYIMKSLLNGGQSLVRITKDILEQEEAEIQSEDEVLCLCDRVEMLIRKLEKWDVLRSEFVEDEGGDRRLLVEPWVVQMAADESMLEALIETVIQDREDSEEEEPG